MSDRPQCFLALDLGASSGRVMLGRLAGARLQIEEVHRFEHHAALRDGHLRWNWDRILTSLREGLRLAVERASPAEITSLSCDSWAQDFGLLDEAGRLLAPPVSYRDARTRGLPHSFAQVTAPNELVRRVGSVASPITTLCQLRAMAEREPELLSRAHTLLHIADLVHCSLCGARVTDRTLATASQLRNLSTGRWDRELLDALAIPHHFLPEVVEGPVVIGHVGAEQAPHPRLAGVPVIASAGHDTAAAAVLLPSVGDRAAFVMSGTWSMLGVALDNLLIPDSPADDDLALLGLPHGRWGLFRSIMGLWLIQECRRIWAAEGAALTFADLADAARAAPRVSVIDPDHPRFLAPDNMPGEIRRACAETGQPVPETPGEVAQVIFTSLALDYRMGVELLARIVGTRIEVLRVVGGGAGNAYLCQLAADALQMPVVAGPLEATAIGNLLLQAQAAGALSSPAEIASVAADSFPLARYEPASAIDSDLCHRFADLKCQTKGQV